MLRLGRTLSPISGPGIILAAAFSLFGCTASNPDSIIPVKSSDPEMNAAMAKARAGLPKFIAVLQKPPSSVSDLSLKARFQEGKAVEHMWLHDLTYVHKAFHGQLVSTPDTLRQVKYGDWLDIQPSEVSDWSYVENGKLVGGFTEKLLRKRMTPAERQEFDKSLPYKMD